MKVTQVKMSAKEYESGASCNINYLLYEELQRRGHSLKDIHEKLGFLGDNRKRFRKMWGSVSFCYRGAHFYYNYAFQVQRPKGGGQVYYVATAKDKGTVYEKAGRHWSNTPQELSEMDKAFVDWLIDQYLSNPAND